MSISPTQEIIDELRAGRMVILVDDEDRENEGDLMIAADFVTPEAINFMAKYARGLVCLTLNRERCDQLGLAPMARDNRSSYNTAFTTSIEAAEGVTTGISAYDRARTVQVAVAKNAKPQDIVQPGHIFPITAKEGGVLMRAGHTEAGCDLTALAGLTPASVICEIMNEDGSMARLPELLEFADKHHLKIGTIADLISYRNQHESIIERIAENELNTAAGAFHGIVYRDKPSLSVHLALVKGDITPDEETLVRVHQPLSMVDLIETRFTSHSWNLLDSMKKIHASERGILVLLNCSEESAESFVDNFNALGKQKTNDSASAKSEIIRNHGIGAQILRDIGVGKMKLLANPKKMPSMTTGFNLDITGYLDSKDI
ncbi:bifunctional 3,4-dihydroxy-2-butanone-4-phosphate synthase/GTP cyclohydrolase II [Oxalobacter formigenes]|uniref:3,4-dihydroxy-2-butanone 4-phosphate synthase n=1 Tax=Oxalobacter formigenes OXCC13 TaxID=556269 RepID=C3XBW9_OXAFO|nr:bifunctional 3,4-dihydroxy-2-butanone-4-phosphate synthase/GTP cyclohydrolase II [Oxalobacter formigenes]ARQ45137.1 Riboflavin biosynthesis protein RibBA [Oxalobacter formigenes]ARQ77445.1 3,4-dihydroxy-2-butanone-4-phosphate synthase [Oxalobacter formigenes OXCC13]EEO30695.1 3,4-dihydroxy-2-butanone-4-phosphate synthase [Oxalobacter formigenes OXCC13]MCZ4062332.1 bifunctional 3,4-dihydroxy-2-butanone-4-phosphate synthase/GTP cyclohydrolase II [Oxalobacter formigenes]QDX34019.1 3,4-dihydrox